MADERAQGYRTELKRISAILLDENAGFAALYAASNALFTLLSQAVQLDTNRLQGDDSLASAGGKALGPLWAAFCIRDFVRTQRFVRGLHAAVLAAKRIFSAGPVHILYAGTGPFASLALPLTTVFDPDEIQFTLLEIQPESVQLLTSTLEVFGLGPYVRQMVQADACVWQPAASDPIHIILTETMQTALEKEPQVAITTALSPFLEPAGFLIPEKISVRPGLLDPAKELERMSDTGHSPGHYLHLYEPVFELTRHTRPPESGCYPPVDTSLQAAAIAARPQLCLFTEVQVFGPEIIGYWQSGITLPKEIMHFGPENSQDQTLRLRYRTGAVPGFEMAPVEPAAAITP